ILVEDNKFNYQKLEETIDRGGQIQAAILFENSAGRIGKNEIDPFKLWSTSEIASGLSKYLRGIEHDGGQSTTTTFPSFICNNTIRHIQVDTRDSSEHNAHMGPSGC